MPRPHLRRPSVDPQVFDCILAVVLFVGAQLQTWLTSDAGAHRLEAALLAFPLSACVALRRRYPAAAGVGAQGVMVSVYAGWGDTQIFGNSIAWFCALYGLVAWTPTRKFVAGTAFVFVSNVVAGLAPSARVSSSMLFAIVTLVVMLLVRLVLGDRDRRLRLAERERDLAAREAVIEERARIARELHDAIAHNVSMMVVQAGAERRVLDEGSAESTREVLGTIEQIGRGALTEMRRLVGMLRSDTREPLAPQPSLDGLPTLVAQVREAGLPVELSVEGERRELPVGIELSAFRIVQEALTNALKHAGDASASVHVRYGAQSLELEISDDGAGSTAELAGGGHGLVGMRERVSLYGGRFDAGRRDGGGFTVRVLLPIR